MLCVVIPVLNHIGWTDNCLKSLSEGTIKPPEIILIDNGSIDNYREMLDKHRDLNIWYIRNEENIGVNASWNLALNITKRKNVMFLNNDTYSNVYFIEKVLKTMENPLVGICSPVREIAIHHLPMNNFPEEIPEVEDFKYIDGWAYTMRKEIYEKVGPIPSSLKTYMGDSYFYFCSEWLGYRNVRMPKNTVWHHGSGTLKDFYNPAEMSKAHRAENYIWRQMLESERKRVSNLNSCIIE